MQQNPSTFDPNTPFNRLIGTVFARVVFSFMAIGALVLGACYMDETVLVRGDELRTRIASKSEPSEEKSIVLTGRANRLPINIPEHPKLCVEIAAQVACKNVSQEQYRNSDVGQRVSVEYGYKFFSGSLVISAIS